MATPAKAQAQRRQKAAKAAATYLGVRGATAVATSPAAPPIITAEVASKAAAKITTAFIGFLTAQRHRDRGLLVTHLGKRAAGLHPVAGNDIAAVARQEDLLGQAFEKASAARVASALPTALAIADPVKRDQAVRNVLDAERRYSRQRSEAMFARSTAAVDRLRLRQLSPQGVLWRLGERANHCPVCRFMGGGVGGRGRFWPWVVIDALHPPVHAQCGCTLHSYGDALANGWITPAELPTPAEALKAAQGVVLPAPLAESLLDELEAIEEAFEEAKHPRVPGGPHGGQFKRLIDVATEKADMSLAWAKRTEGMGDPPPRDKVIANWTKQLRGRLSKDRAAHDIIDAAQAENDKIPLWRKIVAKYEPDHVVITTPQKPGQAVRLVDNNDALMRVAGTTVITDLSAHLAADQPQKDPQKAKVAVMSGYGLATMLRHEYGHSIDHALPKAERKRILDLIPDPGKDLSYYAGMFKAKGNDGEVIPELLALVTHPRYREVDWPKSVVLAGRELLKAIGVER